MSHLTEAMPVGGWFPSTSVRPASRGTVRRTDVGGRRRTVRRECVERIRCVECVEDDVDAGARGWPAPGTADYTPARPGNDPAGAPSAAPRASPESLPEEQAHRRRLTAGRAPLDPGGRGPHSPRRAVPRRPRHLASTRGASEVVPRCRPPSSATGRRGGRRRPRGTQMFTSEMRGETPEHLVCRLLLEKKK